MKFVKKIGQGEIKVKDNTLVDRSGEEVAEGWARDFHSAQAEDWTQDFHSSTQAFHATEAENWAQDFQKEREQTQAVSASVVESPHAFGRSLANDVFFSVLKSLIFAKSLICLVYFV